MSVTTLLIILLVLVLIGAVPSWPHSRSWGYGPVFVILIVILVLIMVGAL